MRIKWVFFNVIVLSLQKKSFVQLCWTFIQEFIWKCRAYLQYYQFHIKAKNVLMLSYLIASEVWRLIPKLLHKHIIYSHSNKLSNHTSFQLFDDSPSILVSLFYSFTSRIALYDATLYKNKDQNLSILIWNDSIGSLPHKVSSIVQYLLFSDD